MGRAPRQAQDHASPIPVRHVRWLEFQDQTAPVGVNLHLALTAFDLLAGIIASLSAALRSHYALAAEHSGGGRGFPADPLPVSHDEPMVNGFKQTGVPPQAEPAEDGALGRQIRRQQPPGNATAQGIEDRVLLES